MQVGLGAKKSKYDVRNHKDKSLALAGLPTSVSTDISILAVKDQKLLGICVACTITSYVEYLYYKKTGEYVELSEDFLYRIIKEKIDKNTYEGTALLSGLKAAQKYGICTKSTFSINHNLTYDEYMAVPIPPVAVQEALGYKIGQYLQIPVDPTILTVATSKYGLVAGRFNVGKEWFTNKQGFSSWQSKDVLPLRPPIKTISGHGNIIYSALVGDKTLAGNKNSWSSRWANQGNGNFYYEDYSPHLTEAWVATLDPVVVDNSPLISFDLVKKLFNFLVNLVR